MAAYTGFVPAERVFLVAEWRCLAMLNYEIDAAALAPRVPRGVELDLFHGTAFVSIVGFRFLSTRVFGVPVPFHRDFDEVNLRFYVRRCGNGPVKRGVVFIQEIVPRRAVAAVARAAYNENYRRLPMSHSIRAVNQGGMSVEYRWQIDRRWHGLQICAAGEPREIPEGSAEEFITEHYWGYAAQRDGRTMEYRVSHPRWLCRDVASASLDADVTRLYPPEFAEVLAGPPASAFLAEGSVVEVYRGRVIPA